MNQYNVVLLLLKIYFNFIFFCTKQNCEKIENNKNPALQKNAEFNDQGYYTCVFFIHHNGKLFNVTKTFNVTVVGGKRNFRIRKKQMCLCKMEFFFVM